MSFLTWTACACPVQPVISLHSLLSCHVQIRLLRLYLSFPLSLTFIHLWVLSAPHFSIFLSSLFLHRLCPVFFLFIFLDVFNSIFLMSKCTHKDRTLLTHSVWSPDCFHLALSLLTSSWHSHYMCWVGMYNSHFHNRFGFSVMIFFIKMKICCCISERIHLWLQCGSGNHCHTHFCPAHFVDHSPNIEFVKQETNL